MNNTQALQNKVKEPGTNETNWKYGDVIKVASANVRGMRDPIKRGGHYKNGENILDVMCLQDQSTGLMLRSEEGVYLCIPAHKR